MTQIDKLERARDDLAHVAIMWRTTKYKSVLQPETIEAIESILTAEIARLQTPMEGLEETHNAEWFFRWIARGKAGFAGMTMEQCADMIWHSPDNPYHDKNPWADTPPTTDAGE